MVLYFININSKQIISKFFTIFENIYPKLIICVLVNANKNCK